MFVRYLAPDEAAKDLCPRFCRASGNKTLSATGSAKTSYHLLNAGKTIKHIRELPNFAV